MRAAVCPSYGPPEVVEVADVAEPLLGAGQVRVVVEAASVNFPDVLLVAGEYQITLPPPFVPGSEFAGRVVEVAGDVDGFDVGDHVSGTGLSGAFAEQVVVGPTVLRHVPTGVDSRTAAAFGVAHRTAYHVIRSVARVRPGDELVVLGAGGGVGLAAVQLGAVLGASVTAVASSPEKLAVARELGATRTIDHRTTDLRAALRDQLAGRVRCGRRPGGRVALRAGVAVPAPRRAVRDRRLRVRRIPRIPLNLVLLKGVVILGFQFIDFVQHAADDFERGEAELDDLLVTGRATPHIGAVFDLDDTAAALRLVADGQAVGKVVIDVGRAG